MKWPASHLNTIDSTSAEVHAVIFLFTILVLIVNVMQAAAYFIWQAFNAVQSFYNLHDN